MSESLKENNEAVNEPALTASRYLRTAREALGLSQEDIAEELYLTPSVIRHIDNNTMDQITKQAFVRGYLRSYARLVKLDGDEAVRLFDEEQGGGVENKIEIRGVTEEPVGSIRFTGPVFQTGVLGLVGLVVIILLVWVVTTGEEEAVPVVATPVVPATETELDRLALPQRLTDAAAESALTATPAEAGEAGSEAAVAESAAGAATQVTAGDGDEPVESPAPAARSAVPEEPAVDNPEPQEQQAETRGAQDPLPLVAERQVDVTRSRSGDASIIRVEAGGSDRLEFTFTDECWVEIEDGEGHGVYGDLNRAGDQLTVLGIAPFEVLFGKAPAVSMSFNGEPIDLAPHTTSVQTAKLTVGSSDES